MSKRDKKNEANGQLGPLTSNPFGALAGQKANLPQGPSIDVHAEASSPSANTALPAFTVQKTRKGGYPIFLEKRPSGKVVTVIRNISGDLEALLKLLKKKCGAGGCLAEDGIEIQGDHRERIEAILRG